MLVAPLVVSQSITILVAYQRVIHYNGFNNAILFFVGMKLIKPNY